MNLVKYMNLNLLDNENTKKFIKSKYQDIEVDNINVLVILMVNNKH
jgi:hypothetical protein